MAVNTQPTDHEMKRWALSNGQRVTLSDGTVFNSSKRKMQPSIKEPQAPAQAAQPEAKTVTANKQDGGTAQLEQQLSAMQSRIDGLIDKIAQQAATIEQLGKQQPERQSAVDPVAWTFSVSRDDDGFISGIVAKQGAEQEVAANETAANVVRLALAKN